MATAPLIRYALDPTGINPDNLVAGEVKTLTSSQMRAAAPAYGPFFAESMIIYDHGTNVLLHRGIDYDLVDLIEEATLDYGKEIMQTILIKNTGVSGQIRYSYQCLGGLYQNNSSGIIALYEAAINDNRPVDWSKVINTPFRYPPTAHLHLLSDVVGFGPLVVALQDVRDAIVLSNIPAFEALIDWVKANASSSVIFDPVVHSLIKGQSQTFNITTSNRPNGSKLYWTIEHNGTVNDNFVAVSGEIDLFQNRGSFTIQLSNIAPPVNDDFSIAIRENSTFGNIVTQIQDIIYIGVPVNNIGNQSMATLLNECCLYEPTVAVDAMSMYLLGDV